MGKNSIEIIKSGLTLVDENGNEVQRNRDGPYGGKMEIYDNDSNPDINRGYNWDSCTKTSDIETDEDGWPKKEISYEDDDQWENEF